MGGRFKLKRKQIYAILLAGVLAAGSVPSAVFAAEDTVPSVTETVEDSAGDPGQTDDTTGAGTDLGSVSPTAVPESASPTETPVPTVTPEPSATPEPTVTPEPEVTPRTDTGIYTKDKEGNILEYYNSLQQAVDSVTSLPSGEAVIINISQMISLQKPVTVSGGKKVCVNADTADGRIVRDNGEEPLTDNMFQVSGEGSELQFSVSEGCKLTVDGSSQNGAAGSIVNVANGASFGMSQGVTLTGNKTSAQGGAITGSNGSIVLRGGSITGNSGSNGAVYTDQDICIQGTVTVNDNFRTDGTTPANLYLDGYAAVLITGEMTSSTVSLTAANESDQNTVLKAGFDEVTQQQITAEQFKTAAEQFKYDSTDFEIEISEDGLKAVLKAAVPEVSPTVSATPSATATPTPSTAPSATATPVPSAAPSASATPSPTASPTPTPTVTQKSDLMIFDTNPEWINHDSFWVNMTVTADCKWFYFYVDSRANGNDVLSLYNSRGYNSSNYINSAKANTRVTITAENVPEGDFALAVAAKSSAGTFIKVLRCTERLDKNTQQWIETSFKKKRPAASDSSTSTREPYKPSVNESIVTGLEEPLQFFPNTFYEFQVIGAGYDRTGTSVSGDVRWYPMYWSTSSNPTENQRNTSWRIGSENGITEAATYNMYIFFRKLIYNGEAWVETDVVEYMATQFQSAEITDEELLEHGIPEDELDNYGEDGYYAELAATEAAEYKDGGSSTKSAVNTADESPLGTMSALAVLSLAAGGYILVRKRKKES